MSFTYTTYRILCSTPAELDEEQRLFLSSSAQFSEQVTMPNEVLFAVASFREPFNPHAHRYGVLANLRMVDFFVHIYGDRAPEPIYQDFVDYALKCQGDVEKPLRRVVVFFKSPGKDQTLREYHEALTGDERCHVRNYSNMADLNEQFREMLGDWWSGLPAKTLARSSGEV